MIVYIILSDMKQVELVLIYLVFEKFQRSHQMLFSTDQLLDIELDSTLAASVAILSAQTKLLVISVRSIQSDGIDHHSLSSKTSHRIIPSHPLPLTCDPTAPLNNSTFLPDQRQTLSPQSMTSSQVDSNLRMRLTGRQIEEQSFDYPEY